MAYTYVVQRRFKTELMSKVGLALGQVFEHIEKDSLHVCEAISLLKAEKRLSKKDSDNLCSMLMNEARDDGETLSFEVLPFNRSILAGENE